MNLDQIATKCFILALFIRDDGERLLLGDGYYDFNQKLQHFQGNTIANDVVEIQGDNGQLLAGQVMRSGAQKFEGYIGDATTNRQTIEQKRSEFMAFFRIKHFYKVIYIFPDGTATQRQRGYLTDAPTIPEIFQKFPEYSVALNFEDANYYEYAEDDHGDEIYAHIAELALAGEAIGGLIWDAIGAVTNGITWSGIQTAQGEYISITNELDIPAKLASVEMLGNASQDGTPTPDSPVTVQTVTGEQVIKNTGSDDSQELKVNLGKNLFDASTATIVNKYANVTGGMVSASDWTGIDSFFAVQPNTTYTFSAKNQGTRFLYNEYSSASESSFISPRHESTGTFTTGGSTHYIRFSTNNANATDLQIELGSTATAYAPYFTPIELAKIGNYQDRIYKEDSKWYIEKQVGKVVLDGTETGWGWADTARYTITTANIGAREAISDHFTYVNYTGHASTASPSFDISSNLASIGFHDKDITSLNNFKTWLASNPTIVYYALATPTTTEITNEALIAQLEALGASSLYLGLNNIGTETLNAMPTLKIEYYTAYTLEGAGYEWEPGGNTAKTIVTVAGVDSAWPIWTIQGGAQNPTLTNITTGQTISWQGFVPEGQTLTINMAEMTADLAGANVFEYITGEWIRLAPGNNTLVYNAGNADKPSTLSWNGVLA